MIRANGLDKEIVIPPGQILELSLEDAPAFMRASWVRKRRVLAPATVELCEDDFEEPEVTVSPTDVTVHQADVAWQSGCQATKNKVTDRKCIESLLKIWLTNSVLKVVQREDERWHKKSYVVPGDFKD